MSALDPVAVWVDLFDLVDHPPTDEELETFGQAIEEAVRANVADELDALADELEADEVHRYTVGGVANAADHVRRGAKP